MSPCPNRGRNGRGCSLRQTTGSLTTFPKPPFPGLARKMTPQHLCHLMSTHVRAIATLSHSSGALGWDPPCSQRAGKQDRWGLVPAPLASSRLQTFPNSRPTCHGGRAGQLSGAPGMLPGPPLPGRPPLPAGRRTQRQARAAWASPIFRPAPRRPAALGEPLPLQRRGAGARHRPLGGPVPQPLQLRGFPGRLVPQARRPALPGAQPLTCRRRRRSTLLQGGAPTRPGCRSLCSPPGQARGGAGASPERRNPRPGSRRRRRAPREGGRGRGAAEAADPRARVQSQAPDAGPGPGGSGGCGTGLPAPDKGQGRRRRAQAGPGGGDPLGWGPLGCGAEGGGVSEPLVPRTRLRPLNPDRFGPD